MDVLELRKLLGLPQASFAEILGVTQPAVAAWEAKSRKANATTALLLEKFAHSFEGRTRAYGEFRGRPIELPDERWESVIKPDRIVDKLPLHLDWTPRQGPRDLRDRAQRAGTYAQVLDEGSPPDVRFWIDPDALADLWPEVPVARHMREPVSQMLARL